VRHTGRVSESARDRERERERERESEKWRKCVLEKLCVYERYICVYLKRYRETKTHREIEIKHT
jgi:hypothetical protein